MTVLPVNREVVCPFSASFPKAAKFALIFVHWFVRAQSRFAGGDEVDSEPLSDCPVVRFANGLIRAVTRRAINAIVTIPTH